MLLESRVRAHFESDAQRFDAIYNRDKGIIKRLVDDIWRGVVQQRLIANIERLEPLAGKSILDIGCGSGRFCVAFAQRGATRVVGVDLAQAMIEIAQNAAKRAGVADRCDLRVGPFPEAVPDGPFDASTANGFFDYVADPIPIVKRMRELTRETLILSFPKAMEWRAPLRRLRFWLNGCPLFLYTKGRVRSILTEAGIERYQWINLGRDYLIVADVRSNPQLHTA